ncbi:SUMF1/EgtB/PvdO family nonheme iron enzyme [Propionivibrio sp.]|uniref:SUMF1/EgtB/PvdO family nonheme iron enzyme n=1 Tax=Propionivibrio sp. TaxID=2212460 RepID=UPI003BF35642
MSKNIFTTVPETTLPCGIVVPSFMVGKYAASKGEDGKLAVTAEGTPWVRINYDEARAACADAGYKLITESQWLAIAWNLSQQACNWSKGEVGKGKLFRGLHKGTVGSAQPGTYVSPNKKENRLMTLSNGEQISDMAGNVWQWVFDDIQGDADGIVAKPVTEESPSLCTAPYPSEKKGMGWRPSEGRVGVAPFRGGYWASAAYSGVFALILDIDRSSAYGSIGFRPAFVL